MKVLYFDCFSGISGDMTLGALLDLGVDEQLFRKELDKLKLEGYKLAIGKSIKNGITGMDVNVILTNNEEAHHDLTQHEENHKHEHGHSTHNSGHNHSHSHDHHARNLRDIEKLIDESGLSQKCGECLTVCPVKATGLDWQTDIAAFLERMAEYGYGFAKVHEKRIGYINFLINITPDCDCCSWSDAPIVPDIGFLASTDPVAIDQASYDLVNKQLGFSESLLTCNHESGADKFHGLRSHIDGTNQMRHGEEIGMGSRDYELIVLQ